MTRYSPFDDGLPRAQIGGLPTLKVTRADFALRMAEDIEAARSGELPTPRVVVSSNGSVIVRYHRDPTFKALLDQVDMIDADGMPLVLASRLLLTTPLVERVATTDFIDDAAAIAAERNYRFFFLGAREGIAARAAARLQEQYPRLQIVGTRSGFFAPDEAGEICAQVRDSGADVLWLGLGSPFQEVFAIANRSNLAGVAWIRTCGGMFDHRAGLMPRAPMWMQNAGLEWLHRAMLEPSRLGIRYAATNPAALYHLLTKTHDAVAVERG